MRDLNISYGTSCMSKYWSNKRIAWDDLCERLSATIRTPETVEEYPKLPKAERDRIKDIGGFVGGQLKGGRRKSETVASRSMLTLDADACVSGFLEAFEAKRSYAACLYSTHRHTSEKPRLRIIIPLSRDVTPDEYRAIARFTADEMGIDQFDECSYIPHQLMYWPSTSSNGAFVFQKYEGDWLDPDSVLANHPNWHDCSLLPTSSRESKATEHAVKHQQDPTEKDGIVGVFCRAYSIEDAIEAFLPDVYEPSVMEGRYDYIPADSSAGVVLYDGKFAYSHHATDPACGKLLNAFDLVRVHKFADGGEKDSVKSMLDFAAKDEAVRMLLADERKAGADEDFSQKSDKWEASLELNKAGAVADVYENYVIIANNDAVLESVAYNELRDTLDVRGEVPWEHIKKGWSKSDEVGLYGYLSHAYGLYSPTKADNAIKFAADKRRFHPIRDYLNNLAPWDGTPRVETLFIRCFQAEDTAYVRTVTRKTFAAAIARVTQPGVKFDSVPVFDGVQGIGKSSFFKELVGDEFYSETLSLTDMDDKTGAEKLQGFWVVEIPEFAGMKKADIEKVKAFISTADDKYRPSYGKVVESHPRQCILVGSVNGERGYLRDITGNRRFWVIKVHQEEQIKKYAFSDYERDQIWAEAKEIWESGEKLYLEGDMLKAAEFAQKGAMELDERQGLVEDYLERLLPENWDEMDIYARRDYIREPNDPTHQTGTVRREYVSNTEIWCECFGRKPDELKPTDSYQLAAIMTRIDGWEKSKNQKRIPIYGKQRIYTRSCSA